MALELLDEDLEVGGRRFVEMTECIVKREEPSTISSHRLVLPEGLPHIDKAEVGWFQVGERPQYEAANLTNHYLTVLMKIPEASYDSAWNIFRTNGVPMLLRSLDMLTYVFGRGVVEKREEDLFIIEFDGFDCPMWELCFAVRPDDTYQDCLETIRQVEHCAQNHLVDMLR